MTGKAGPLVENGRHLAGGKILKHENRIFYREMDCIHRHRVPVLSVREDHLSG